MTSDRLSTLPIPSENRNVLIKLLGSLCGFFLYYSNITALIALPGFCDNIYSIFGKFDCFFESAEAHLNQLTARNNLK